MFKLVRNIIIVIAVVAAVVATYVSVFPSHSYSVVVENRSGQALTDVTVAVEDPSGEPVASRQIQSLADGESLSVRHSTSPVRVVLMFQLGGSSHNHTEAHLSFAQVPNWSLRIHPEGVVKLAPLVP